MRHDPVELFGGEAGFGQHFVGNGGQLLDGEFEHALPVHFQKGQAGYAAVGDLRGHVEQVEVVAVGVQFAADQAGFVGGAEHHRAGAVAKEHAGAAVVPVEDTTEHFGADNQRAFGHAAADVGVGGGDGVDEAGTDGLQVECGAA